MECGVDIIEVSRIENSLKNKKFLTNYFSLDEIEMFSKKRNRAEVIAGNFAAKEAFSKSIRTGFRGFLLSEVSILRNELGAPYFKFSGMAKKEVEKRNLKFSLSISHTKDLAIAMVIAY